MRYLVLLFLLPKLALADPCGPQDYTKEKPAPNFECPSPLEETLVPRLEHGPKESLKLIFNKPAPWEGILMDPDRVIQLGLRITGLRRLRWNDTLKCQDTIKMEKQLVLDSKKADLDLLTSQRESYKGQLQATQKELEKAQKWYRSWTFGLIVGVVTTSAAAVALVYISRK